MRQEVPATTTSEMARLDQTGRGRPAEDLPNRIAQAVARNIPTWTASMTMTKAGMTFLPQRLCPMKLPLTGRRGNGLALDCGIAVAQPPSQGRGLMREVFRMIAVVAALGTAVSVTGPAIGQGVAAPD